MDKSNRNLTVDILRIIGILLVILAHSPMPSIVFEIRTFDVVLLVFISGISFSLSTPGDLSDYVSYVKKRFKRLVLPVWIFLFVFLFFFGILGIRYSIYTMVSSFFLLSGIGYIWIFRVFFINALISPFIRKVLLPMKFKQVLLLLLSLIIGNEFIYYLIHHSIKHNTVANFIELTFIFTIGYLIALIIGMKWKDLTQNEKFIAFSFFSIILIFCSILLDSPSIQEFKYPPMTYYITYGLVMSMILYFIVSKFKPRNNDITLKIEWFSRHSMGIYLWHVVIITFFTNFSTFYGEISDILRYLFVVAISVLMMLIQVIFSEKLKKIGK